MTETPAPAIASIDVAFPFPSISVEAVKRAAYALMAHVTVSFTLTNSDILCSLRPEIPAADLGELERDFRREVLDHDLRLSIEAQTEHVRSAILGLAFSRTGLQG